MFLFIDQNFGFFLLSIKLTSMAQQSGSPGKSVLIANIQPANKQSTFKKRSGCEKDLDNLKYVIEKTFGFKVINVDKAENITLHDWDHKYNEVNTNECKCLACRIGQEDYTTVRFFLLALSSHGGIDRDEQLCVQLSDGIYLPVKDIIEALSIESLAQKTKILIICACRGKIRILVL